jgi:hypothetical protein
LGRVKIRLIGDRESAYAVAGLFASRLKWKEYPLYKDKEQTQIDESKTALYATMKAKLSEKTKSITLDQYISKLESSLELQTDIMPPNAAANPEQTD